MPTGVLSFWTMRLLRALTHLVFALALIGVAMGPARAVGFVPSRMVRDHVHVDHHASGIGSEQAPHDHDAPVSEHPAHKRGVCQVSCCFVPSQLPPHAPGTSAVAFFCAVRYMDTAQPRSGRTDAPDPGIPKLAV